MIISFRWILCILFIIFQNDVREIYDSNNRKVIDVFEDGHATYYLLNKERIDILCFPNDILFNMSYKGKIISRENYKTIISNYFRYEIEKRIGDIGCFVGGPFYLTVVFDKDFNLLEVRPLYKTTSYEITGENGCCSISDIISEIFYCTKDEWRVECKSKQEYYISLLVFTL